VAGLSVSSLAFMAFVRIPIGTALFEEVAFRGVLFGTWAQRRSVPVALGVSSLVFGIWHVVPALEMLRVNRPGLAGAWLVLAVAGACAGTALGGVFLGCLRIRTQGLVAPVVVHASVNALATLAAWTSQHRL
jgi:membrane protease YdiL (CAAX protease family)